MTGRTQQREITESVPLLDGRGKLVKPGYARKMLFHYDRGKVRAGPFSLKEWDFYQITAGEYVLQMTIGHVSYVASFSAALLHPATGTCRRFTRLSPLPLRSLAMPENPEEPNTVQAEGKDYRIRFETLPDRRVLSLHAKDGQLGSVDIEVSLKNDPENEKMVIATPFFKDRQFYLNYKENYYGASGRAQIGDLKAEFGPEDTALMDWGRGVWPFKHEWFWGNGAAFIDGGRFGFNIGWGFGDLRNATENMFFWNGRAYKLGALQVERDTRDYMAPWRFRDEDGCFDLTMTPVYDNYTETKIAFINTHCHQVFGKYSGAAVLPGGDRIEVRDLPAFCEHAENRW
jgi:hypothetical protein